MSDKRSAALSAIGGGAAAKQPEPSTEPPIVPSLDGKSREKVVALPRPPGKVTDKVMLYLPPKVARKFKEMALYEDCKAHDLYLQALEGFLREKGHAAVAELLGNRRKR